MVKALQNILFKKEISFSSSRKRFILIFFLIVLGLQISNRIIYTLASVPFLLTSSFTPLFEEPWQKDTRLGWIVHDALKETKTLGYVADESNPEEKKTSLELFNRCRKYAVPAILRSNITDGPLIVNCSNDTQAERRLKEINAEWILEKGPGVGWAQTKSIIK